MRSALFVNLLTEDNLPYYFRTIERMFGATTSWGDVGPALDRRGGPPLDRDPRLPHRHPCASTGRARAGPHAPGRAAARCPSRRRRGDGFVYVALQELATRIAHRNTGKLLDDQAGYEVMERVAADENLHYLFYRDLVTAALELDPSGMVMRASSARCATFEMPGTGIPDFEAHATAIAKAGIYDLAHPPRADPRARSSCATGSVEALEGLDARGRGGPQRARVAPRTARPPGRTVPGPAPHARRPTRLTGLPVSGPLRRCRRGRSHGETALTGPALWPGLLR